MNAACHERYDLQARVLNALGHPIRLAIVEQLRGGERCVCDLAERIGAERSNVSRHLALMRRVGVLGTRREGLQVFYRLRTPCVLGLLDCATEAIRSAIDADSRALAGGEAG